MVNNAGILRDGIFHRMSADDWLSVISVHLNGCFFVSRAAAEHYRRQESGAFVHITSTSGLIGNVGQANYAAAKLGITALSKSIALDMQRYNVRSNCLSPWAWSRMTSSIPTTTPEQKAAVEKLQRMTPDKNAPLAVYLSFGRGEGRDRPGVRHADARDLFVQLAAADPHRASRGWLDPGEHCRTRHARAEGGVHAAGYVRRGVSLGSGVASQDSGIPRPGRQGSVVALLDRRSDHGMSPFPNPLPLGEAEISHYCQQFEGALDAHRHRPPMRRARRRPGHAPRRARRTATPKPICRCGRPPVSGLAAARIGRFGVTEFLLLTGHLSEEIETRQSPRSRPMLPRPLTITRVAGAHPSRHRRRGVPCAGPAG